MSPINHPSTGIAAVTGTQSSAQEFLFETGHSFSAYIFGFRDNRRFLRIALAGSLVQLIIFKLCYPFPDFMSDSYNYIESAAYHLNVNIWPIGYAKFLAFIHQISYNDTLLVAIQYLLVQISLLYFFYTVKFLYRPSTLAMKTLFVLILFNPVTLYISNYVLSDAVFGCITIFWFSLLLRQIKSPSRVMLLIQLLLMGLAFTIRYTAIYYPFIAAVGLMLSPLGRLEKLAWMVAPAILFLPFIWFTQLETEKVTGTAEFSVFGGWQAANNALYMYGHIQVDSTKLPPETRGLDRMVKQYYKWAPPGYINLGDFDGTFFIKHSDAPLKQYMYRYYRKEYNASGFLSWGKVSPMYNKYGSWLISHYPMAFARYYLWLNTNNYFSPFLAQMSLYNLGEDSVWDEAQYWFRYPTPKVKSVSKEFQGILFFCYPPGFLLLNFYYAACILWLLFTRKLSELKPDLRKALWLFTAFWIINFWFSILATPVVMRYEVVPMLFLFTFSTLLLEFTDFKKTKHA
jgi:hypothetical protein